MRKKILIVLSIISSYTHAQQADTTKVVNLQEVTVTASGEQEKIHDYAGSVHFITNRQIKELGVQSVGDAMRLIPGANFIDEDGRGIKPSIGLRGLDPYRSRNLLMVVDGKMPLGESYSQLSAYYMMPSGPIDKIEIIRGASPVLYGGGSIGGVMNIVTKTGVTNPYTRIYGNYGSYNMVNAGAESGRNNGKFGYYVGYNRRQGDGPRSKNSAFHTDDVTLQLASKPTDKDEIKIFLNAFWEDSHTPGGLSQAQYDQNYRQSVNDHDNFIAKRFSGNISYTRSIDELNKISVVLYGSYFIRDWWMIGQKPVDQTSNKGALRDIPSGGVFVDYKNTAHWGTLDNTLLAGARIHADIFKEKTVKGDGLDARSGTFVRGTENPSNVYEGYIYDQLSVSEQFVVSPGIRYTYVDYGKVDLQNGSKYSANSKSLVYSLGLVYKPVSGTELYGTFSKGYQPPAVDKAVNTKTVEAAQILGAETSNNIEVGVRSQLAQWLNMSLTGYLIYFNDKIINEGGINRNAGKSFHRGIELELNLIPVEPLKFYASGSLLKATFSNGKNDGNYLPYAPTALGTVGVRYSINTGRDGTVVFNIYDSYTGKQYNDAANTELGTADGKNGSIPAYNLLNGTVNFYYRKLNVSVNLLNALDKHYFTKRFEAWGGIMPATGRTLSLGVSYTL